MATESVSLAASVAGLLSLGLQITGGIVKYMDAFEGRDEELRNVKKQNANLGSTLHAIKTVLAGLQGQSPAVAAAVDQNIRSCEEDLRAVEALCIELSDRAGSSWTNRLENKKRKATFAFHRPKLRDLELQLQKAHGSLQLIQGSLGLETSNRNTALLAAIQSSSRDQASEMLLVRSEVAAFATPVAGIHDKLPGLQSSVDQTRQLIVAHSGAIEVEVHESSQRVRHDLQQSHNSITEHLKTIDHKLQLLGEENSSLLALALRAASKPAALKSLCDDMKLSRKPCNLGNTSQLAKSHRERTSSDPSRNLRFGLGVGKVCICPHPERSFMQMQMQRGHTYLSGEWESQGHWSSCPLSKTPRKQRLKASLKYTGVSRLLKSAIEISFALTSGAGGCSISPSFTYYPTADVNSDPAFRLFNVIESSHFLGMMQDCSSHSPVSTREHFLMACMRKLARLLEERRTYPTVVDHQNKTLMHHAAYSVKHTYIARHLRLPNRTKTAAGIFPLLLSYGVPPFSYDIRGLSPLHYLTYQRVEWAGDAIVALSRANAESQPTIWDRTIQLPRMTNFPFDLSRSLLPMIKFSELATAFECGPLSIAVINNDSDEVDRVLSHFPDSLAELDIYGRSPLHLATTKPEILERLVKTADLGILDQQDSSGANALEMAMMLSSRHCVNGKEYVRCKGCSCFLCAKYLLDARYNLIRTLAIRKADSHPPDLVKVLEGSSELTRRYYIFHMRKAQSLRRPGAKCRRREDDIQESNSQPLRELRAWSEADEAIGYTSDRIFRQITSVHMAQLFYRHGFMPGPSVFLQLPQRNAFELRNSLTLEIVCWLLEHGGDLLLRSPAGPVNNIADDGVFAAHYVFYLLGRNQRQWMTSYRETFRGSATFETITVACRNLTDGCHCHCSTKGCSPSTWLMKGFAGNRSMSTTPEQACLDYADKVANHYRLCGPELTLLTYEETIRFITFEALDLFHSCCNTHSLVEQGTAWIEQDDTEIFEDQGFLLELHEKLVAEFTHEAGTYMEDETYNGRMFPQFWTSYWAHRMTQELEVLHGEELTELEKRDAEEIGVVWHELNESDEREDRNPYHREDLEHYFFELDLICPEYNEPWPEGLRRIH